MKSWWQSFRNHCQLRTLRLMFWLCEAHSRLPSDFGSSHMPANAERQRCLVQTVIRRNLLRCTRSCSSLRTAGGAKMERDGALVVLHAFSAERLGKSNPGRYTQSSACPIIGGRRLGSDAGWNADSSRAFAARTIDLKKGYCA